MGTCNDMRWVLLIVGGLCANYGWAQAPSVSWPARPITIILSSTPGSFSDIETRLYSPKLTEGLGKPVLIDYKPGAGTSIGTIFVAKSAPNGYTLIGVAPAFTVYPAFFPADKLPYDPVRDFAPISQITKRGTVLLAHPSLGVKNFAEYIAYARANPEAINFGTSGSGGILHMVGAWLHSVSNTKVTFIHYKSSALVLADLMGGRVSVAPTVFFNALPFVKSGKLIAVANMGPERSTYLPDLRTVAEQGYPDFDYPSWSAYLAPARTPDAIIDRLSGEFAKIAKSPDLVKRMNSEGTEMVGSTPEQLRRTVTSETARWRKIVQENNIKLEE